MSVNCQVGVLLASDVEELNIAGLRCADNLSTTKKKTAKLGKKTAVRTGIDCPFEVLIAISLWFSYVKVWPRKWSHQFFLGWLRTLARLLRIAVV